MGAGGWMVEEETAVCVDGAGDCDGDVVVFVLQGVGS